MTMEWYVIHAYSGYENKVREALMERIERFSMEDNFGEIMVPSEEVVELRGGQEKRIQRKFFPGYVLVKMELNDSTWHLVKDTPKVMGFIGGSKDKPIPISEEEAKGIMQQLELGAEVTKPKITFEPGEIVRVIDGPFNDFSGVVEEVNYEKSKVRVAVLIFGRSTPVELSFNQIEKA
ncbi:MAG TPA: transcription termination/antitermination protein NusG [Gammaproteobacteria bacterium]|nr:transcription termination/antitermination protein NusG [Gammaproteobacteria bacterium]